MPEDDSSENGDQAETETRKRQDGDGNDSKPAKGLGPVATINQDQGTEKEFIQPPANEETIEAVGVKDCSEEPTESLRSSKSSNAVSNASYSSSSPARAGLSSQRDLLRQQFRLLHSQELIRRILQSSGALPNNFVQSTSSQVRSPGKTEKREEKSAQSGKALLISSAQKVPQDSSNKGSKEAKTKDQRPQEFCDNSLEGVKPHNDSENKREKTSKTDMESDTSFVCSVCSCKQEEHSDMKDRETEELLSTSGESCLGSVVVTADDTQQLAEGVAAGANASAPKMQTTARPNVEELSERLHKQPSHEMLDEILRLLQNQAKTHPCDSGTDENQNTVEKIVKKPVQQAKPLDTLILDESLNDEEWQQKQQQKFLVMRTRPNLREKHSRQLSDMKNYYESELGKLRDQLDSLRGNLSNLQEAIPMKMLEAANQKLEARCRLMEEIANELKGKCQKFEQTNEELERSCIDLRQTNDALEMKCNFLQKSAQDMEEKQSELQNKNKILESKVLHMTKVNEVNSKNCKQLEESNKTFEAACKQLEISNEKFEVRYRKCKEENLKLSCDLKDLQGSLQTSRKHAQEQENLVASLESEKNDWILKLNLAQKMAKGAQKRLEEIKIERNDKETLAKTLEIQMGVLTLSCENAAKAKADLEQNAERDRELLKRLLTEYDALVKENQKLQDFIGSLTNKVDISQDEVHDLRGTISTLVLRNSNLEESLKEALSRSARSTPDSFVSVQRRAWDSPVPLKSGEGYHTSHPSLSSFESIFDGKGKVITSSPTKDDQSRVTEADMPQKDQSTTPPSVKFEIPWGKSKSITPNKNTAKRNLEKSFSSDKLSTVKSPNNLVVKKSDLVTRFDVVFKDSLSGAEVKRSHTGRTSRGQGESPTSIFVSNSVADMSDSSPSNVMVSSAAEAALNALRSGRVVTQADWEGRDVKSAKGRRDNSSEKKKIRQSQSTENVKGVDRENDEVPKLERKFSSLTEERQRLESTLSRIPTHRVTKRSKDDKAFLENRLEEVIQDIGSVRMQLRQHHAL